MQKGIDCEQQSTDLLNNAEFKTVKAPLKLSAKSNRWITGECDILMTLIRAQYAI